MREINDAFRRVASLRTGPGAAEDGSPRAGSSGERLSREEVERLVQGLGTDGPVNWVLDSLKVNWDWHQKVSRTRMSITIAWGVALFVEVVCEWSSIGKEQRPGPWIPVVALFGSFVILLLVLPKD